MLHHFDTVMSFAVVMLLLSLLVTTLVQMILAAIGLRASVLKLGLERLLLQVFPALNATEAGHIVEGVLKHPMLQHVNGRRATSIRKEELIRLLNDIATRRGPAGYPKDQIFLEAKAALKKVASAVQTPEFGAAVATLKAELEVEFPAQAVQIQRRVDDILAPGCTAAASVGTWFDTVMDRTTENFLAKTRWITAGVALVLAFGLHVDSARIIRQLASQPELRARLVQSADATLRKAEGTFGLTAEEKALASASIASVKTDLGSTIDATLLTNTPSSLVTRQAGEAWLRARLAHSTNRESILAAYHERFDEGTKVWLHDLTEASRGIAADLKKADLTIIPDSIPSLGDYWKKPEHFLGTLMTVLFLSLGAPFWYNALRRLANLRPAVAEKIESAARIKP